MKYLISKHDLLFCIPPQIYFCIFLLVCSHFIFQTHGIVGLGWSLGLMDFKFDFVSVLWRDAKADLAFSQRIATIRSSPGFPAEGIVAGPDGDIKHSDLRRSAHWLKRSVCKRESMDGGGRGKSTSMVCWLDCRGGSAFTGAFTVGAGRVFEGSSEQMEIPPWKKILLGLLVKSP